MAHAGLMTISLVPASPTVELDGMNDPLVLDVVISNPDALSVKSWSIDVGYDAAVFEPLPGIGTAPAQGFELGDYIPSVTPQWNPLYQPGIARGGVLNFGASSGSSATGLLAQLTFDAVGLSAGSTLSLTGEVILLDGSSPAELSFAGTEVAVVPEPVTVTGLLLGLVACLRRRRA